MHITHHLHIYMHTFFSLVYHSAGRATIWPNGATTANNRLHERAHDDDDSTTSPRHYTCRHENNIQKTNAVHGIATFLSTSKTTRRQSALSFEHRTQRSSLTRRYHCLITRPNIHHWYALLHTTDQKRQDTPKSYALDIAKYRCGVKFSRLRMIKIDVIVLYLAVRVFGTISNRVYIFKWLTNTYKQNVRWAAPARASAHTFAHLSVDYLRYLFQLNNSSSPPS